MKKMIMFVVMLCCTASVFAAGNSGKPFVFTAKTDLTLCVPAAYVTPEISFTWQPGLFGLAVEGRCLIGLEYQDVYLVGFGLVKLGWLYVGVGYESPIALAPGATVQSMPALTAGLDIPIFTLGPGKLGLNISADWILTVIPAESENAFGAAIGTILLTLIGSVKASAGVLYSIPL